MSFKIKTMKTIFIEKKSMLPQHLQPIMNKIGFSLSSIAVYLNVKVGFLSASFGDFILSKSFNSILAIVISLLSILWLLMKIYDQFITTKMKKEAINGSKEKE